MAALTPNHYALVWSNGISDKAALYALRNVTTGDTADLSSRVLRGEAGHDHRHYRRRYRDGGRVRHRRNHPGRIVQRRRLHARLGGFRMSGTLYWVQNAAFPTTAAPVKVATGTAVKTMLQIGIPSTVAVRIVEWGIQLRHPRHRVDHHVELFGTTVAASTGTSITPIEYGNFSAVPSLCVGGTALHLLGTRHRRHRRQLPALRPADHRPTRAICEAMAAGA